MKIALLTLPLNSNYGGVLQAFALKSHLTRLGHEVWLIDNRKRLKPVSNAFLKTVLRRAVESLFHPKEIFAEMNTLLTQDYKKSEIEKFIYRRLSPKTQPVFDAADYAELAASGNGFDLYIVGSDQVWRPRYAGDPEPYFFSFLEGSGARRISYAASFGAGDCEYTREQRMRCGELLAGFEGVSVREDTAVGQCREYFGCDRAVHVLDPAMLLTADDYRTLFTAGSAPSDTLYCYLFRVKPGARHILQDFAERHNLRVVRTTDRPNAARGKMPGIGEWLAGLHEARYVITDSFHACVFCILFHKSFAAYINRSRGSARIHSLLKQFGLESRILSSGLQDISMLDTPIDWEAVDRILERRRAESYAFLDAHLCPASDTVTAAEPDGRAATAKAPAGTGKRIPATRPRCPKSSEGDVPARRSARPEVVRNGPSSAGLAADVRHRGADVGDQVRRCDLQLQAAHPGTDVDERLGFDRRMDIGREGFLHADRRTAAADVSRHGQQLLHRDQIHLLVARDPGCRLEVHFVVAGNHTDEIARAVALEHKGLEDAGDLLAQLLGDVCRRQMLLVHAVGHQFVGDLRTVEQPCGVRFLYLRMAHIVSFVVRSPAKVIYFRRIGTFWLHLSL